MQANGSRRDAEPRARDRSSWDRQEARAWLDGPTCDGWWIVYHPTGMFSELSLVRCEHGECFSELGAPMGRFDFEGMKWTGPVERPFRAAEEAPSVPAPAPGS